MTDINEGTALQQPEILYQDTLPGGTHWSLMMRRGTSLRLVDREGGANLGMMMFNPHEKLERYNAPDTLKCQHTFKLTKGHCLYSDMGRIMCSIVEDTVGWHDTVSGYLSDTLLNEKYAVKSYQKARNGWTISAEHAFMVELAKYELNLRDIAANINWFTAIKADEQGNLDYVQNNSTAGDSVSLRFEMDTLVIMNTCPHPMDPAATYPRRAVTYQISQAPMIADDDLCLNACDENRRGFENNRLYHIGAPKLFGGAQ